jgi:hypothetical protein
LLCDEVDRGTGRVAPKQRPLRPAQNFDAIEVEQTHALAGPARNIDIVDVDADG